MEDRSKQDSPAWSSRLMPYSLVGSPNVDAGDAHGHGSFLGFDRRTAAQRPKKRQLELSKSRLTRLTLRGVAVDSARPEVCNDA
jgi:hypothetical protein